MIRFISKAILYTLLFLVFMEFISYLLISNFRLSKAIGVKKEFQNILELTKNANTSIDSDTLYLGDSVGRQLFPTGVKKNYVTSTGGTLVHGNLVLLKKALKNNPSLKVVNYVVVPYSLGLDIKYESSSSSFIKPFMSLYNLSELNESLFGFLKSKPLSLLYLTNTGKFIPMDDILFGPEHYYDIYNLSDYAIQSIRSLVEYCNENGLILNIVSPPLPEMHSERKRIRNIKEKTRGDNLISPLINRYLDSIIFLPRNLYRDDLHLSRAYLRNLLMN